MPSPITMPKFGMTMTEGTIVRWSVTDGDCVEKEQPLAEIESDKLVNDLEAPATGTVTSILFEEGSTVQVGEVIGWILLEGESKQDIAPPDRGPAPLEPSAGEQPLRRAQASQTPASVSTAARPLASPTARREARARGVDLETITGTGPKGRITKEDVLQFAGQQAGADEGHEPDTIEPLSAMRQAIVRHVIRSAAIPQIVLYSHADASVLLRLREHDPTIAFDDMIAWCVARALVDHRYLNASFCDDAIRLHQKISIGLAVTIEQGLVIPVLRDAAKLSLRQISAERSRLVERARSRKLTAEDTCGSAFTLTNLGMYPVDRFEALLNPPGVAIMSIGRIQQVAGPGDEGGIGLRPIIEFGLTLDHRVVDGAAGAAFLKDFVAQIETIALKGA